MNIAPTFRSPLRPPGAITPHRNVTALVQHCINEANAVNVRGGPTGYGLDAKTVMVVNMDNVNLGSTTYHQRTPAPPVGHPLHYDAFIQRLCSEFQSRFH